MRLERNRTTILSFFRDVIGAGNLDLLDKLAVDDYDEHVALPGQGRGREGLKRRVAKIRAAFQPRHELHDVIVEADDRQLELIVDEKFNRGLTPNLIAHVEKDDYEMGLHHGFKGMQIACSALTAEALKLSNPVSVFSRSTEAHNQDKVSMGTIAARDARSIVELVQQVAAIHLLALCQAMDLRGAENMSPKTQVAYRLIREYVPFVDRDRRMDTDIEQVVRLIRSSMLRQVVPF